ncbi:hypothetical protein ACLOJK_034707 [Asimina triloba]
MAAPLATPHRHLPFSSSCSGSSASASRSISSAKSPLSWESFQLSKCRSRRSFSLALVLLHSFSSNPQHAYASSIFDKYVKRKKLDPLEAYVPAVVLTQFQFKDIAKTLENDLPQYADCRSLLRSGPAASLRVNMRAVAQYASDDGKGKAAFDAIGRCIGALEDLDSLLLQASRNDPTASVESMKAKISAALAALDRVQTYWKQKEGTDEATLLKLAFKTEILVPTLNEAGAQMILNFLQFELITNIGNDYSLLQTVPPTVLDRGKAIADAYRMPSDPEESNPEELDPEMKQLTEIL